MNLRPVKLKTEILGYGPTMDLTNEGYNILNPQQVIALSSMMTYKDQNAKEMALELMRAEKNLDEKITSSLMNSAARGHASLSTSAGIWILFTGSSKFVDSLFTSAIYSSSLMPSGRRIGVGIENIVAPEAIANASESIKKLYFDSSVKNINLYDKLIEKKIPKDEASKILQYGTDGGGFIFLPLETIIGYKKEFEIEKGWVPDEGPEFIRQMEEKVKEIGMDILYHARDFSGRNVYPSPNIFKNPERKTIVSSFGFEHRIPEIEENILEKPFEDLEEELKSLYKLTKKTFESPENVRAGWENLLMERFKISKEFRNAVAYSVYSNIPWRVWGEVKRHRTVDQQAEPIYCAIDRAKDMFRKYTDNIIENNLDIHELGSVEDLETVFSVPPSIKNNKELRHEWLLTALKSFDTYEKLVDSGISEKDAIAVIPRGLKFKVFKQYDLSSLLEGYLPLRMCGTAEEEMRRLSEEEHDIISANIPKAIAQNMGPKCASVGFCPEPKCCGEIGKYVGFPYTKEFHERMNEEKKAAILSKLL